VYNVAVGERTSLNQLYGMLHQLLLERHPQVADCRPHYADFRAGDVRHSQADIGKAASLLGYMPTHDVARGLKLSIRWYGEHLAP